MTPRPGWKFVLLGAAFLSFVAFGPPNLGPGTVEAQQVTQGQPERFEQWINPTTGEAVRLRFGWQKTTLERGGKVAGFQNAPFSEEAEKEKWRSQMEDHWSPMEVSFWRKTLLMRLGSLEAARQEFLRLGLPQQLWDDLNAFERQMGRGIAEKPNEVPSAYSSSLTIALDDETDSLLWNPPAELRRKFAEIWAGEMHIAAPPAETTLWEQSNQLTEQGFIRISPRRPDGSLWLPPALEPHREELEASEKPVLRLAADPSRQPKLWESKVGGIPYRLKGHPWPMSGEKTPRPLVFLAQLNLAQVNAGGKLLPDLPQKGLLQFFILNTEFYGADFDRRPDDTSTFRVLYVPDVVQDEAKLDTSVPPPQVNPEEVERMRADGLDGLLDDEYLIWERLPHHTDFLDRLPEPVQWPFPAVALASVPDREPVSGADDTSSRLLGLNLWADENDAVMSALYSLAPGGHKVGGYPDFTQSDPRPHWISKGASAGDWQLLFQLDSDPRLNLMWGDNGTASFFIRPEDLKKLDFSRVAYHWDCG